GDADTVQRAAVEIAHHGVLRHVDEATGEVTGVRGLERGIGQTLARAVRGDEVLEHRETFTEVRRDGRLDDFAGALRHQAATGRQLTHLLRRAARARIGHDVHGIEAGLDDGLAGAIVRDRLFADHVHHLFRHAIRDAGPDIHHLVVALAVRDQA